VKVRQSLLKKFAPIIVVVVALTIYGAVNPFRAEHFALVGLFVVLAAASRATRDLAVALVPVAIFGLIYDLLRLFAERSYHAVIVEPIYHLEQTLFGWVTRSPNDLGPVDFFREHHHLAIDLLAGFWYSTHVPAAILFGLYLWWMHWRGDGSQEGKAAESRLHKFMWGYLAFNVLGFVVWIVFPVAAPWYVEQYGFGAPGEPILGDPAALGRVDQWLGYPHFSQIYEQGTYVFGAMPSLHVAPSIWIALWARKTPLRVATWIYAAVMSFFAVYLGHHYIIDVLAGGSLAAAVYGALAHTHLGEWPERAASYIRASFSDIFAPQAEEEPAE
jgi:membrane-associated phospholipid phosphatase